MRLLATFALMVWFSLSAFAADVTGKWKSAFEGPEGKIELVFNFKVEGTTLSGTVTGPQGDMAISEGKVSGDSIEFTVATDQFKVVHKGTLHGDELQMKVEIGDQVMDMVAKRVAS